MTNAQKVLIGLMILAPQIIWDGFVTLCIWSWFAVPLGLPSVTWAHAIGLGLLWSQFSTPTVWDSDNDEVFIQQAISGFIRPGMLLLFAYIVLQWM